MKGVIFLQDWIPSLRHWKGSSRTTTRGLRGISDRFAQMLACMMGISSRRRNTKCRRARVIVGIRKSDKQESFGSLEAAGGSPLVACFSKSLKIVVQHSRMANQTHLFFSGGGVGSNHCAAPGAHDVVITPIICISRIDFIQHDLLHCSLQTNLVPVIPALT